jgi:L-ribulokinase
MTQHTPTADVVGVDFGTLSGRAVVVRVADGGELGTTVHEYPRAVLTEALPGDTPLGHDWAVQRRAVAS